MFNDEAVIVCTDEAPREIYSERTKVEWQVRHRFPVSRSTADTPIFAEAGARLQAP